MITPHSHPPISGFVNLHSKAAPPTAMMSSSDLGGLPCGLAWLIFLLSLNLSNLSLKGAKSLPGHLLEAASGVIDHLADVPDRFKARREISHAKPQGKLPKSLEESYLERTLWCTISVAFGHWTHMGTHPLQ